MIQINGTITLDEGVLEHARDAIIEMVEASRAEDGCIDYTFAQDLSDPNVLVLYERWRDQEALQAHSQSAHMAKFQEAMQQFGQPSRNIRMYATDEGTEL
ncbi:putative quinol monooxygenase [Erythrobacter sp. HKB08]|uniref:putative quinol monooxygenase n=1 Tax=Erythrobacter sp. HKB08 TaxID=2502843 RepID=UPI0010088A5F|nr:putative quinol monooxygenase [Erythrobacter sp. HKB08]